MHFKQNGEQITNYCNLQEIQSYYKLLVLLKNEIDRFMKLNFVHSIVFPCSPRFRFPVQYTVIICNALAYWTYWNEPQHSLLVRDEKKNLRWGWKEKLLQNLKFVGATKDNVCSSRNLAYV